jgi:hypothetical protein
VVCSEVEQGQGGGTGTCLNCAASVDDRGERAPLSY